MQVRIQAEITYFTATKRKEAVKIRGDLRRGLYKLHLIEAYMMLQVLKINLSPKE
jgi:hypothetical protein